MSARRPVDRTWIRLAPLALRRRPVLVTFFVTSACGLRCAHCCYHEHLNRNIPRELTIDEIERLAASMPPFPWLLLTGGEPFLRRDLGRIALAFNASARFTDLTIPTAGLHRPAIGRFLDEVASFRHPATVHLNISYYGPAEVHERVTGVPDSAGRTLETLDWLAGLTAGRDDLDLSVNLPIMAANQEAIDETIDLLDARCPGLRINVGIVRGSTPDPGQRAVDPDVYRRAAARLAGRRLAAGDHGVLSLRDRSMHERNYRAHTGSVPYRRCLAGQKSYVITETGAVHGCELRSEVLGQLREVGLDFGRILAARARRDFVATIDRQRCQCTHECNQTVNGLYDWSLLLPSLRDALSGRTS